MSPYTSVIVILTLALAVTLTASAQKEQSCGTKKPTSSYRTAVKSVVNTLADETPRSQIQLSSSPNNSVGSAAGSAICRTRVTAACRGCLNKGKDVLLACDSTVGVYNGDVCVMVFWNIFD